MSGVEESIEFRPPPANDEPEDQPAEPWQPRLSVPAGDCQDGRTRSAIRWTG
jgi:hypothetical protein